MKILIEGRRRELVLSSVLYLLGALVTALAPDFPVLVIGRFLFGIGIGLVTYPLLIINLMFFTYSLIFLANIFFVTSIK